MDKKEYLKPEIDIIKMDRESVIRTSGLIDPDSGDTGKGSAHPGSLKILGRYL